MTREQYNWIGGGAAAIFAIVSIIAALNPHSKLGSLTDHVGWGKIIVFVWAFFPPLFFWFDWIYFCQQQDVTAGDREIAKHTHDLARNIWLGLLGVITFTFFKDLGLFK
jgi:hypothetical protein